MKVRKLEDGTYVFTDKGRVVAKIWPPAGGFSKAELLEFEKHLIAHLHGAN